MYKWLRTDFYLNTVTSKQSAKLVDIPMYYIFYVNMNYFPSMSLKHLAEKIVRKPNSVLEVEVIDEHYVPMKQKMETNTL